MRENLPFDDFVKQQFSSYSPDVPGHIWENIIARRSSKPKGFWVNMLSGSKLIIMSLILVVGGGAAYLLLSPGNNTLPNNIVTEKNSSSQALPFSNEKNNNVNSSTTLPDNAEENTSFRYK
jgi:hypothetical protein